MKNSIPALRPLIVVLLTSFGTAVVAQEAISGASSMSGTSVAAPSSPSLKTGRAWAITPRIGLNMTATDNVRITGNAGKESELITELSPGIRMEARTARLKGYLDYALRGQYYLRNSDNRTQNALNAFATFEALDDWLFIDFSGNIAQQSISAFGTQSPSDTSQNDNSTETSIYRLSPYIQGKLGGAVDYLVRYNASTTRSDASSASDIDIGQWVGRLSGSTPFRNLQWSIDGNRQTTDYSGGRTTDADLLRALASYAVTPQFRLSVSGGWERNNYASLDQESRTTHGYGFDWNPTPRTQISAFKEDRFFGNGHRFSFNHRFPMSSIRFSDTRDVSVLPNQFATAGLGSIYDLYFEQFASQIPDPVIRAAFVTALLAQSGINPNQQVTSSFLSSRASVQRQQQLALVLFGARNSITLQVNRSESSSLLAANAIADDFSQSSVVRQRGISLNVSHRLSPLSSLNASASRQQSTGTGTGSTDLKTTTNLYMVSVSTKLGAKATGSLSLRHSDFDNATNPYTENALLGTVTFTY